MKGFLPICKEDMKRRGWDAVDFVLVTGDAYVDHPSFGVAIISRVLEAEGFRVGIVAQPDWKTTDDFARFGRPRLGFMVTSGNIDSMVAHYTAAKKRRSEDFYSPGRRAGLRPDRAVIVYCQKIRERFGDIPLIIGGLEASLRRFAHYDYWDDAVRASILADSGADLLSYGMGENQTIAIARRLDAGETLGQMTDIRGTCYFTRQKPREGMELPSFEAVRQDKRAYAISCRVEQDEQDAVRGHTLYQAHGNRYLVQNPPMPPLSTRELDRVYALPYERYYHPVYEPMGGVPAIEEVEFSITHNRGCFGACNFCSLAFHQGRAITCRSEKSILAEAEKLTHLPRFKGYIHDVGGPTANFRLPSCEKQLKAGLCKGKKCLAPTPCKQLRADHTEYLALLRKLRQIPGVKRVFIRSGIRYDYLLEDPDESFFRELVRYHVSGQLKVAPEHCSAAVLDKMGKPHIEAYKRFQKRYFELSGQAGKEQYLVPYLMSSHPGSTLRDAVELALFLKREGLRPQQVQDFYPTPGTISTCMYHTELDPYTMKPVFVPKTPEDKARQRALLQYFRPENRDKVRAALRQAGRADLIGSGPHCLVPDAPRSPVKTKQKTAAMGNGRSKSRKGGGHQWDPKGRNAGRRGR